MSGMWHSHRVELSNCLKTTSHFAPWRVLDCEREPEGEGGGKPISLGLRTVTYAVAQSDSAAGGMAAGRPPSLLHLLFLGGPLGLGWGILNW